MYVNLPIEEIKIEAAIALLEEWHILHMGKSAEALIWAEAHARMAEQIRQRCAAIDSLNSGVVSHPLQIGGINLDEF
jgi:hypothetical protein